MQNSQGSQVLYDCRIQSRFIIRRNILRQRLKLCLFEEGIHGQMDSNAEAVRIAQTRDEIFLFGILRIGPCAILRTADINGIRPRIDCRPKALQRAGGRQKFRCLLSHSSLLSVLLREQVIQLALKILTALLFGCQCLLQFTDAFFQAFFFRFQPRIDCFEARLLRFQI